MAIDWSYADPLKPQPDELLRELNGKALVDVTDAEGKVIRRAGEQLASFGEMRDDGSTDGSMWIYTGVYGPKGNFAQRRDNSDPSGSRRVRQLGLLVAGQPPHPVQPRLGRSARQAVERGEEIHVLER